MLPPVTVALPVVSAAAGPEGTAGTTLARTRTTAVESAVETALGSQASVPLVHPRAMISTVLGSAPARMRTPKRLSSGFVARLTGATVLSAGQSQFATP